MAGDDGVEQLREVILCGIHVSQRLHAAFPNFPKQVFDLATMAEAAMKVGGGDFKIDFHPRNYGADCFIGKIESSSVKADIVYDNNQNTCWRRFVAIKEICHVFLYSKENLDPSRTSSPEEVEGLISSIMANVENDILSINRAVNCDSATKLMALEILLPHHQRPIIIDEISKGTTTLQIAVKYRLPEQWVRFYLTSNYAQIMKSGYGLAGL